MASALLSQTIPSSLSAIQTAHQQTHGIRLRQACDSCTVSKVRCDRSRPACQRCLDSDQLCEYSASRRYGKRAKHIKTGPQQTRPSSSAGETPLASRQTSPAEAECYIMSPYNDIGWENNDTYLTTTETTSPFPPRIELDVLGDSTSCELPTLESTNYVPSGDRWMKQSDFPWGAGEGRHRGNMPLHLPTLPFEQKPATKDKTTSMDIVSRQSSENFSLDIEHALECEARAITVLRSLHYSPTLYSSELEGSVSGESLKAAVNAKSHRSTSTVHTMESLLFTNKAALSNLTHMLRCRCVGNPHIALLCITILFKVIFWYKVAVTTTFHSERVELKPMKIQLGMLDLDDDDYATLHRAALLRELHKAGSVIQAFEARSAINGVPVFAESSPWVRLAVRAVWEELQEIIQENERR